MHLQMAYRQVANLIVWWNEACTRYLKRRGLLVGAQEETG